MDTATTQQARGFAHKGAKKAEKLRRIRELEEQLSRYSQRGS